MLVPPVPRLAVHDPARALLQLGEGHGLLEVGHDARRLQLAAVAVVGVGLQGAAHRAQRQDAVALVPRRLQVEQQEHVVRVRRRLRPCRGKQRLALLVSVAAAKGLPRLRLFEGMHHGSRSSSFGGPRPPYRRVAGRRPL